MKSTYPMLLGLALALTFVLPNPVAAQTSAHEQIRALGTCYARGTDAIGSAHHYAPQATTAPDQGLDPNFTKALALYRACFTDDFEFNIILNNGEGPTIPWLGLVGLDVAEPALLWANFVNNTFRGGATWDCPNDGACNVNRYESTQHQLGSIFVSTEANTGFLESYLTATHTYHQDASGDSLEASGLKGMSVAFGTYQNDVVKVNGTWRIKKRDLILRRGVELPHVAGVPVPDVPVE